MPKRSKRNTTAAAARQAGEKNLQVVADNGPAALRIHVSPNRYAVPHVLTLVTFVRIAMAQPILQWGLVLLHCGKLFKTGRSTHLAQNVQGPEGSRTFILPESPSLERRWVQGVRLAAHGGH
jgi:hypothetical protein